MQKRKPKVSDFRDQIGIYVLMSAEREVVYIGQVGSGSDRLFNRLRHHTRNHLRDRWTNFSWFGFRDVNTNGELSNYQKPNSKIYGEHIAALDEIEAVLLQLFEPRLNKQGPRWGKGVREYFQYAAWEWNDDEETPMKPEIEGLYDEIDNVKRSINKLLQKVG